MLAHFSALSDTLGRRSRIIRCSTGKRLTLKPRDVLWFQKLHEHGPLPSSYLLAFSDQRSEKRATERLGDLFHESDTPHGAAYLDRPWQQFETVDARYNQLVYDLTEVSEQVLHERGLFRDHAPSPYGSWKHRFMVACITASIELGTLSEEKLQYIPQHEVLRRSGNGLQVPITFKNPVTGKEETRSLIPDAVFGLVYLHSGEPALRFFCLEADRNTEPNRSYHFNRKSYRRSILQYREYVGRGLYKEHLHVTAGMVVVTVTTNDTHMQNLLETVSEAAATGKNSFMLFKSAPVFGACFKPPLPMPELLTHPWHRAGHPPFAINHS